MQTINKTTTTITANTAITEIVMGEVGAGDGVPAAVTSGSDPTVVIAAPPLPA